MKTKFLQTFFLLALASPSMAQSLAQMQQIFPDKMAVFSNIKRSVEIAYKNGIPYAEANEISEMMILNDNANGIYNKDKVYYSAFNELKKVEAYTLVPEGSNTKKIKVSEFKTGSSRSQNVFYDDLKETSFDYPRMLKGSVSHVETEHYNKDIRFLSTFYFSNYLPVHTATYSITYPENVDIHYIIRNDVNKMISVKQTQKGRKKKLEFAATDVKNYERFGDGTSIQYYALHVIVYVASYHNGDETVPVFSSLDELYKWNTGFLNNVNAVADDNLKKIADSLCHNKRTDREKAQAIYFWVQNHVKYVAFEDGLEGFVPRQAADVCVKRYGDCKDMASILTAMLKISGLNASFTWIGTRSIPYTYMEVPLPLTGNHMISAVKIDRSWIFLDATDPNCIFGMPTIGIQDKEALISINPEKYELVKVPIIPAGRSVTTDSTFLTISNNTLHGKCSVDYSGYYGNNIYNDLTYNKGEDEREYIRARLTKGSNKFIMQDYSIRLTDEMNKLVTVSSTFEITGYTKSISGEIYINLNLEKLLSNTQVDTIKRKIAIENDFLYTINQVHMLEIPEGYKPDYIPRNTSLSNELLDFSITYKQDAGQIWATQKLVMKKLYIQPRDFPIWNNVLSIVAPAYKEQVVLKKTDIL